MKMLSDIAQILVGCGTWCTEACEDYCGWACLRETVLVGGCMGVCVSARDCGCRRIHGSLHATSTCVWTSPQVAMSRIRRHLSRAPVRTISTTSCSVESVEAIRADGRGARCRTFTSDMMTILLTDAVCNVGPTHLREGLRLQDMLRSRNWRCKVAERRLRSVGEAGTGRMQHCRKPWTLSQIMV